MSPLKRLLTLNVFPDEKFTIFKFTSLRDAGILSPPLAPSPLNVIFTKRYVLVLRNNERSSSLLNINMYSTTVLFSGKGALCGDITNY